MRTQQQADREEQQRIKNLVLNYEASNENEAAESKAFIPTQLLESINLIRPSYLADFEKRIPANQLLEKSSGARNAFRSRKLQLSDVKW